MEPIARLFDEAGDSLVSLPAELERLYGGPFHLADEVVYANFVSSVDGVAAIPDLEGSSSLISGGIDADRFVMGLLRACADVVLIGAGTLRAHPRTLWTPSNAFADAAEAYAELRETLGHKQDASVAVVTGSGRIDPDHPGLRRGAIVLTTRRGMRQATFPEHLDVVDLGERNPPDGRDIVDALRGAGFRRILTEGGPSLMGTLLDSGVVDELFLTVSPVLAGRTEKGPRPGIVDATEILPDTRLEASLRSARRAGSAMLLRYGIGQP